MRLLFKAKYIILSVLFLILLLVGTKSGWLVQRFTFAKALQHDLTPNAALKNDLNRCLRTCNPKDKILAERFVQNILLPIETQSVSFEAKLPELRKIILEAANNYIEARDTRSAVEVYDSALALNSRINFEPERDLQFLNEIHSGIERLVAKFPRNGHAYYIWGKSLFLRNSRDERSMAAFQKCLSILPTESACQQGLETATTAYTEVRCEISGLKPGVVVTLDKKDKFDEKQVVQPEVAFGPKEISEIWPVQNQSESNSLMVRFTDNGMSQLRKAYRDGTANSVSLKTEEKTLATAVLSLEAFLSSNAVRFEFTTPPDPSTAVFETVCLRPQRPELPKKLSL
jgi:tetratricopeptide (TPR) repeat protein